jgi:hypothetical protein
MPQRLAQTPKYKPQISNTHLAESLALRSEHASELPNAIDVPRRHRTVVNQHLDPPIRQGTIGRGRTVKILRSVVSHSVSEIALSWANHHFNSFQHL